MIKNNQLDYTCGISDEDFTELFRETIKLEAYKRKMKGIPEAKYDVKNKLAYLEYPNGRIEYIYDKES